MTESNLKMKAHLAIWFQRDGVHHGTECVAPQQNQEAETSHFVHTQEVEKEKEEGGMEYSYKPSAPLQSDIYQLERLYLQKAL